MHLPRRWGDGALVLLIIIATLSLCSVSVEGSPRRILVDTDVDTDDLFAILYLLKLNRSQFELEVWSTNQITEN